MATLVVLALFALMIATPCLVAVTNATARDEEAKETVKATKLADPKPARRAVTVQPRMSVREHTPVRGTAAREQRPVRDRVPVHVPLPEPVAYRPLTLPEKAAMAESDAVIAQELARQAHWAALAAVARAATLRADAAEQAARLAGQQAQDAIDAAERVFSQDLLADPRPSVDLPRPGVNRRRAA